MITSFHFLLIIFWVFYAALHSLLASVWFKATMQKFLGKNFRYYRLMYSCFAAITLLLLIIFQFSQPGIVLHNSPPAQVLAGTVGAVAGSVVMIICIKKYFINLSGVDVLLKTQLAPVLEKGGLHRYIRHPLYSGTLLLIWSLFLIAPLLSNLIACGIITIYTLIGIRIEEKKLIGDFGDEYKVYAMQTPMLIPFLKVGSQAL